MHVIKSYLWGLWYPWFVFSASKACPGFQLARLRIMYIMQFRIFLYRVKFDLHRIPLVTSLQTPLLYIELRVRLSNGKGCKSDKVVPLIFFFDFSLTPSSQAPVKSNKIIRFRFLILLSVYEPLVNTKKYQKGIRVIVIYDKECRSHAKIPSFSTKKKWFEVGNCGTWIFCVIIRCAIFLGFQHQLEKN